MTAADPQVGVGHRIAVAMVVEVAVAERVEAGHTRPAVAAVGIAGTVAAVAVAGGLAAAAVAFDAPAADVADAEALAAEHAEDSPAGVSVAVVAAVVDASVVAAAVAVAVAASAASSSVPQSRAAAVQVPRVHIHVSRKESSC